MGDVMASEKEKKVNNIKEKVIKIEDADRVLPKKNEKKTSNAYLFGKAFGERLRSDKLFLASFVITLSFLCFVSYRMLRDSESSYPGFVNRLINSESEEKQPSDDNKPAVVVDEELDISDKVGIYSREVSLGESISLSDSCVMESYKYIYQIKKDKTITKYLFNECLGVISIWSDKLDYITIGDVKYIGTSDYHFLFSGTSMREADGDTYKIDDSITSVREKNLVKNLNVDFVDNSVIFSNANNIILLRGNSVVFDLSKEYPNNGGNVEQRVYRLKKNYYKFMVFENGEELNCYEDNNSGDIVYKIYSLSYDEEKLTFKKPEELIARKKSDGCSNWKDDLGVLKS